MGHHWSYASLPTVMMTLPSRSETRAESRIHSVVEGNRSGSVGMEEVYDVAGQSAPNRRGLAQTRSWRRRFHWARSLLPPMHAHLGFTTAASTAWMASHVTRADGGSDRPTLTYSALASAAFAFGVYGVVMLVRRMVQRRRIGRELRTLALRF